MCLVYMILHEQKDGESEEMQKDAGLMSFFWTIGFCCCLALTASITGGSLNPAIGVAINLTMFFDTLKGYSL